MATRPELTNRVAQAKREAIDAFWAKVAESFPEVKTGDFDPLTVFSFERACERAIEAWLEDNLLD